MRLNTLKPAAGSKKTASASAAAIGSGLGKTCGRGHKGQQVALGRLPQGRLRGRSDAAAASPAEGRFPFEAGAQHR
jgi:hypothetical protein